MGGKLRREEHSEGREREGNGGLREGSGRVNWRMTEEGRVGGKKRGNFLICGEKKRKAEGKM